MLNCTDLECILHHHHYYAHLHHLKHGTHVDEGKFCFSSIWYQDAFQAFTLKKQVGQHVL